MKIDLEKARREELRWVILRTLYSAQEIGASESIIRRTVEGAIPDVTEIEIRRGLDYMAERNLLSVERNRPVWFAKINRYGIDIAEYTLDCDPGIARPRKW
jgi:hypothetical protein